MSRLNAMYPSRQTWTGGHRRSHCLRGSRQLARRLARCFIMKASTEAIERHPPKVEAARSNRAGCAIATAWRLRNKARQSAPNFLGWQPASWMRKDHTQSVMQSFKDNVIAVRKLVEQPEHAVHLDPLG
jgi:hypothetical protein